MPMLPDTLQSIELGILALQHEVSRAMMVVARGNHSEEALVNLAFAQAELGAMLHLFAAELRESRRVSSGG